MADNIDMILEAYGIKKEEKMTTETERADLLKNLQLIIDFCALLEAAKAIHEGASFILQGGCNTERSADSQLAEIRRQGEIILRKVDKWGRK